MEGNAKLIELTMGKDDGEDSMASDSEPSEDNLEEDEMLKIIPIVKKKKVEEKPKKGKRPESIQ